MGGERRVCVCVLGTPWCPSAAAPAYLEELQLDKLDHIRVAHDPEDGGDDVLGAVAHVTQGLRGVAGQGMAGQGRTGEAGRQAGRVRWAGRCEAPRHARPIRPEVQPRIKT